MNFNKYHVSKNLWDGEYTTAFINYRTGEYATENTQAKTAIIEVLPSTSYAIKKLESSNRFTVCVSDTIPESEGTVTVKYASDLGTQYIVTTDSNSHYLFIYVSTSAEQATPDLMVNIGNEYIPYEPYGNTWHDTPHYVHNTSTDTITTPADIYANDTTATVGLKGNMSQTGTPTPTSPIMPEGCGDYSNLFNEATAVYGKYIDGNGIEQTSSTGENNHSTYIPVKSGLQYTLAETKPSYGGIVSAISWYTSSKVFIQRDSATLPASAGRTSNTWTAPSNAEYAIINFYRYPDYDGENDMLNEGSTALPFEPYGQYKIPISSGGVTTNIYLGSTQTVRQVKKLVFDGTEENWRITGTGRMAIPLSDLPQRLTIPYCTHFIGTTAESYGNMGNGECSISVVNGSVREFGCYDSSITTLADFKAYLQQQYANGTPVTVWYVLATETTGIVNEPLRKIGDYADTVSGITIPTIAGANTISVGTTLQPSEITVNYKGWHPVQSVHERDNGAWT